MSHVGRFALAALVAVAADAAPCGAADVAALVARPAADCGGRDVDALLTKLNAARRANGVRPLALEPALCAVARSHGLDMARRGYFDHVSPEGVTPFGRMDRAHYRYGYAGENLAIDRDAAAAHRAFLQSSEHRDNILERHYARVGIATVLSPAGEIVVEDFSD